MINNVIAILYGRFRPQDKIENIFKHEGKIFVEAYPKGEDPDTRLYCAFYVFDAGSKTFGPYTPFNLPERQRRAFLAAAES